MVFSEYFVWKSALYDRIFEYSFPLPRCKRTRPRKFPVYKQFTSTETHGSMSVIEMINRDSPKTEALACIADMNILCFPHSLPRERSQRSKTSTPNLQTLYVPLPYVNQGKSLLRSHLSLAVLIPRVFLQASSLAITVRVRAESYPLELGG